MLHSSSIQVFTIILLTSIISSRNAKCSGVFEIELIKFQPLDVRPLIPNITNQTSRIEQQQQQQQQSQDDEDQNNFIRILVCLKEAFTSHLDGACTFGNASITLSKDSIKHESATSYLTTNQIKSHDSIQRQLHNSTTTTIQQQHQTGSLMTNIVRILFTFRWTKSFTIILTAEEPSLSDDDKQRRAQVENSGSNRSTIDSSTGSLKQSTGKQESAQLINRPLYIDRHVLTENEVLPNLDSNPNKPWSSRFSRTLKSSLAYKFRVYCSLNYYGDECNTFCRARDDQFGHYNCSSTGQKVCLDGWSGPACERARCRSGCNQQHGYCDKPDTCQCRPGWKGARCDECITYPGCQNGICLSPWQCICQRNWGGVLCDQDLNYCGTHEPCKNNGTCQNIAPGKYKCNCLDNFTGVDCDLNLNSTSSSPNNGIDQLTAGCALNPCLNGGTCYGFNSLLVDSPIIGPATPDTAPISSGAQDQDRFYRCQCGPGWTGDYCQWPDKAPATNAILNTATDVFLQTNETSNMSSASTVYSQVIDQLMLDTNENDGSNITESNIPQYLTPFVETTRSSSSSLKTATTTTTAHHHVDMRHFISGVLIASVVGVFLAFLFLTWCCLIAIERNKFSFIQMNIIRGGEAACQPVVSSAFRRMQDKIRESFRRSSRQRIKPETKLSIENVLKPPPTYEESKNYATNKLCPLDQYSCPQLDQTDSTDSREQPKSDPTRTYLVTDPASTTTGNLAVLPVEVNTISDACLTCPRHKHLYLQKQNHVVINDLTVATNQPSLYNYVRQTDHINHRHYHHH